MPLPKNPTPALGPFQASTLGPLGPDTASSPDPTALASYLNLKVKRRLCPRSTS